ncbi:MAG: hypothetical protein CL759_06850 [Chloroflexi bacterium]|nr:hypothetical protein [Chloroflexota bacterium]|tara:strand:+ start:36 stop:329 length:294 start_codon:yes stop_codon:yes gene_type:complete
MKTTNELVMSVRRCLGNASRPATEQLDDMAEYVNDAEELIEYHGDSDSLAELMDAELREKLHDELAVANPTTQHHVQFVAAYMLAHEEHFGAPWVVN